MVAPDTDIQQALALGRSALLDSGDLAGARVQFELAARHALAAGDTTALAQAALGLGGLWVHEHRTAIEGSRIEARQRRALEALEPGDPLGRRLRLRIVAEQDYRRGQCTEILAELDAARASGDPVVLADALNLSHHCLLGPRHHARRLELADELLQVAGLTGRPVDELLGLLWRSVDLLLLGDPHAERAIRELTDATRRTEMGAIDFVLAAIQVMITVRRGDFDPAEKLAAGCHERGARVGDIDAEGWFAAQVVNIRWYQGRLPELIPMLSGLSGSTSLAVPNEALLAALAVAQAQVGDEAAAAQVLQRIRGRGLAELPDSSTWLITMAAVIEAAALLGDADLAAEAYGLLETHAELPLMASLGVVCFGSAHYSLGRAAVAMGRPDLAVEHLQSALLVNNRIGHRPAVASTEHELAAARVLADEQTVQGAVLRCRRDGADWLIGPTSRLVRLPNSVGLRYLGVLIGRPDQEIAVADLVTAGGGPAPTGSSSAELLDDVARRRYAERAHDLQVRLEEAQADADDAAVEEIQTELDWLTDEVQRATGLGGRPRHFVDDRERARTAVQKAIRRAIGHIGDIDPQLGAVLTARVVTGSSCCYRTTLTR